MAGDNHGDKTQEEPQAQEDLGQQQAAQDQSEQETTQLNQVDYQAAIAERDQKIAALEEQVASAAKSVETAEKLSVQIDELRAQSESDRIDFKLQFAGVRNVKAARAILADHGGDIDALKEAEPWLFAEAPAAKQKGGKTGLPNADSLHGRRQDHEALAQARRPGRFQRQRIGGLRHGQQHRVR